MVLKYIILLLAGSISSILTYVLHVKLKQGAVRASSLVGILAGLFVLVFPELLPEYITESLALVVFGASFVGMVSSDVLSNYLLIGVSGGLFAIIFINASSYFEGFGGGLGTGACIALLVTLSIPILTKNRNLHHLLVRVKNRIEFFFKAKNDF